MPKTYAVKRQFTDKEGRNWMPGQTYTAKDEAEATAQVTAGNVEETPPPSAKK